MSRKHMIIPIFIPHKGCPFDCIYCNQKVISGQIQEMTQHQMESIVERHLSTAAENAHIEIAFYGGSFTGIETDKQIMFLETASKYVQAGKIRGIRLSTRPDYIDEEIIERLRKYSVSTVELGVQSLEPDVLLISGRGHTVEDVERACILIRDSGINLGIQTMIGLPNSDYEKEIRTAIRCIDLKPKIVRIYPTLVIKNTYMEKMYLEGKYTPLNLNAAVGICAKLLELYEQNGIKVIRIGLQPTDNINENFDVLAGPFHPSFRQLVESRVFLFKIENYIKEYKLYTEHDIIIYTGKSCLSNVIGQRRENIEYLKAKYNFKKVEVICDERFKDEIFIRRLSDKVN